MNFALQNGKVLKQTSEKFSIVVDVRTKKLKKMFQIARYSKAWELGASPILIVNHYTEETSVLKYLEEIRHTPPLYICPPKKNTWS